MQVMERARGDLFDHIMGNGALAESDAKAYFGQVLQVISASHPRACILPTTQLCYLLCGCLGARADNTPLATATADCSLSAECTRAGLIAGGGALPCTRSGTQVLIYYYACPSPQHLLLCPSPQHLLSPLPP